MTNKGEMGLSMPELTLWKGDCLELMKNIPDKSVDMVLADYASGMSMRAIAKKSNTNHKLISKILKKNGVKTRKPKKSKGD